MGSRGVGAVSGPGSLEPVLRRCPGICRGGARAAFLCCPAVPPACAGSFRRQPWQSGARRPGIAARAVAGAGFRLAAETSLLHLFGGSWPEAGRPGAGGASPQLWAGPAAARTVLAPRGSFAVAVV